MNRRQALATVSAALAASMAGCAGVLDEADDESPEDIDDADDGETDDEEDIVGPEIPLVEDPPDAVYIPTHREGMLMPDPVQAGEVMVGPMLTYPHPFWLVSGKTAEVVEVTQGDDLHLMATLWDPETGTVIPTDEGFSMEVTKDGEVVDSRAPWTMLSQTMGAHFGDNVPLDGPGTYEVEVTVPSISTRLTGELADRLGEGGSASFEFTFDQDTIAEIVEMVEWIDEEHWGEPGALEPDHHGHDHHDDEHDHDDGHDDHDHGGDDHDHDHDHDHELGDPVEHIEVRMETHDDGSTHFVPHVVHVEVGGTVEWVLESGDHDTVALHPDTYGPQVRIPEDAEPWESPMLIDEGETFERTFEVEGVYDYVCTPHVPHGMIGSVVVGHPDPADEPGLSDPDPEFDETATEWLEHYNERVLAVLDEDGDAHDHDGHDHQHPPFSRLPEAEDLPGAYQGTEITGDADIAVSVVGEPGRFTEQAPYLLISPRTPYNRVPLPEMALTVSVERGGEQVAEESPRQTIDHAAGHHYGVAIPELEPGDEVVVTIETPPQTSRHQGYETAFLEMPPVEFTIDEW